MKQTVTPVAEYNRSAKGTRVLSQYENDLIFEQPRDNLLQQEFKSYEYTNHGVKVTTIVRKFTKDGDYHDIESSGFIGS
tara:strand:+ start:787 stop:1023 length:237 start_codon:yes stop_codon:yes gene_type:complete